MQKLNTIGHLLLEIDSHDADCTPRELRFFEKCLVAYQNRGTLPARRVARLEELLSELDDRAGFWDEPDEWSGPADSWARDDFDDWADRNRW